MLKNPIIHPHLLFHEHADNDMSREIEQYERDGEIRKLANGIYLVTDNIKPHLYWLARKGKLKIDKGSRTFVSDIVNSPEYMVRENLFEIIGNISHPNKFVISHRSAFELKPTGAGYIFVSGGNMTYRIKLPGIMLQVMNEPGPLEGDIKITDKLYTAQPLRAIYEHLNIFVKIRPQSPFLPWDEITQKIKEIALLNNETEIQNLLKKSKKNFSALPSVNGDEFYLLEHFIEECSKI